MIKKDNGEITEKFITILQSHIKKLEKNNKTETKNNGELEGEWEGEQILTGKKLIGDKTEKLNERINRILNTIQYEDCSYVGMDILEKQLKELIRELNIKIDYQELVHAYFNKFSGNKEKKQLDEKECLNPVGQNSEENIVPKTLKSHKKNRKK